MSGLELLLLSAVVAASPTTPTPWFVERDYPIQAFDRRWEGVTAFELTIDPRGRPVACAVVTSSGHEMLDRRACSIAQKRARFTPATASNGAPAYGVYRSQIRWAMDPAFYAQSELGPDFEVSLNKLPAGVAGPVSVKYAVEVDAAGTPVACSAIANPYADALGALGCSKLKQDFRKPVPGSTGTAVQTAWITFTE